MTAPATTAAAEPSDTAPRRRTLLSRVRECIARPPTARHEKVLAAGARLIREGRLSRARRVLGTIVESAGDSIAAIRARVLIADAFHREGGPFANVSASCEQALLFADTAVRSARDYIGDAGTAVDMLRVDALMTLASVWREYPAAEAFREKNARALLTEALEILDALTPAEDPEVPEKRALVRARLAQTRAELVAEYSAAFRAKLRAADEIHAMLDGPSNAQGGSA